MESTRDRRGSRIVLAVTVAASILLAGCSTPPPTATPSASAGFYYEDAVAGFAITFPDEPLVEPRGGSDEMRASYSTAPDPSDPDAIVYMASGTQASSQEITPEQLESPLFYLIDQMGPVRISEETFEFEGIPALTADFTDQNGKPSTMLVAGEDHRFYQLAVFGGTAEDRQAFFDSFILLDLVVSTPTSPPVGAEGHFEDVDADYAITFPGEPTVESIPNSDSLRATYLIGEDPAALDAVYYIAIGDTTTPDEVSAEYLESIVTDLLNQGLVLDAAFETFELEGMPALTADLTDPDGRAVTIVVAGEGRRLYQLILIGGTQEEGDAYFGSFKLLS